MLDKGQALKTIWKLVYVNTQNQITIPDFSIDFSCGAAFYCQQQENFVLPTLSLYMSGQHTHADNLGRWGWACGRWLDR